MLNDAHVTRLKDTLNHLTQLQNLPVKQQKLLEIWDSLLFTRGSTTRDIKLQCLQMLIEYYQQHEANAVAQLQVFNGQLAVLLEAVKPDESPVFAALQVLIPSASGQGPHATTTAKVALSFLAGLGYLAPQKLSQDMVIHLLKHLHLVVAPDGTATATSEAVIDEARMLLQQLNLIEADGDDYTIVNFVQQGVRYYWEKERPASHGGIVPTLATVLSTFTVALNQFFTVDEPMDGCVEIAITATDWIPHITTLLTSTHALDIAANIETATLLSNLGSLHELNDAASRSAYFQQQAQFHLASVPSLDAERKVSVRDKLLVRKVRALLMQNQSLQAKLEVENIYPDLEQTPLSVRVVYAQVLCHLNEKTLTESFVAATVSSLNSQPSQTARFIKAELNSTLARLYHHFGPLPEAKKMALDAIDHLNAAQHRSLAKYKALLSSIHQDMEEYDAAISTGDAALEHAKTYYGHEHLHVAKLTQNYAFRLLNGPQRERRATLANDARVLLEGLIARGEKVAHQLLAWGLLNGVYAEYQALLAKKVSIPHVQAAVASGSVPALVMAAKLYLETASLNTDSFIHGLGQDFSSSPCQCEDEAYQLLTQAATVDREGAFLLAKMILAGQGGARERSASERVRSAFPLLSRSAEAGFGPAQYLLGICYLTGRLPDDVEPSNPLAKHWLEKAESHDAFDPKQPTKALAFIGEPPPILSLSQQDALFSAEEPAVIFLAEIGYVKGIEMLYSAGYDLNVRRPMLDDSALNVAAKQGHASVVVALIAAGVDVSAEDSLGMRVMHHAALGGHSAVLRTLVNAGIDVNQPADGGCCALHFVTLAGNFPAFQTLVALGANLNAVDDNGLGVLHSAARGGNPEIIRALIEKGADVNQRTRDGATPIYFAAQAGHIAAFEALVALGADKTLINKNGRGLLHSAAQGGSNIILRALLDDGQNVRQADASGKHPINVAALGAHHAAFQLLVAAGADCSVTDNTGRNVLHNAAQGGHPMIVRAMVAAGQDIESEDISGNHPLHVAAMAGHFAAYQALLDLGADVKASDRGDRQVLLFGSQGGNVDILRSAIAAGVDVNHCAMDGNRPLHFAAMAGHLEAFEFLIESGADPKVTDFHGRSIIHSAAQGGQPAMIRRLVALGVDVNQPAGDRKRGINYAALHGHFKTYETFVALGANIAVADVEGWSVLHHAAQGGNVAIIKAVVAAGVDVNIPSQDGGRPVHIAALNGKYLAYKALVELGADVNIIDNDGWSVLHSAAQGNHPEIIRSLVAAGLDLNRTTNNGKSPLTTAIMENSLSAVEALLAEGVDPNTGDRNGLYPIHTAAGMGSPEMIRALLAVNANINQIGPAQRAAVHFAIMTGKVDNFKALVAAGADLTVTTDGETNLLLFAMQGGSLPMIREIITAGVDVNASDRNGMRPIHAAVILGSIPLFLFLLRAGAGIDEGVLELAMRRQQFGILQVLMRMGDDSSSEEAIISDDEDEDVSNAAGMRP